MFRCHAIDIHGTTASLHRQAPCMGHQARQDAKRVESLSVCIHAYLQPCLSKHAWLAPQRADSLQVNLDPPVGGPTSLPPGFGDTLGIESFIGGLMEEDPSAYGAQAQNTTAQISKLQAQAPQSAPAS